jgi:hypothetical protein
MDVGERERGFSRYVYAGMAADTAKAAERLALEWLRETTGRETTGREIYVCRVQAKRMKDDGPR